MANPDYIITIQAANLQGVVASDGSNNISVAAYMPNSFAFDSQAEYAAPFSQGVFGSSAISDILKAAGMRLVNQAMTAQIWQGSSETRLSVELEFQTENDPIKDVRNPILDLMRLTTPIIDPGSGLLTSPGPQLDLKDFDKNLKSAAEEAKKALNDSSRAPNSKVPETAGTAAFWKKQVKNQISIKIGRYAFFDSVVITDVQKTYESQFDAETGWPLYAKVSVAFKPLFLLVQSDLADIFAIRGR